MIDINSLTLGEVAKIEELAGVSISSFSNDDAPQGKMLAAIVFVSKRRDLMRQGLPLSGFTWNDALGMQMDEVSDYLDPDSAQDTDEDDPEIEPASQIEDDSAAPKAPRSAPRKRKS
jgi:hypothetical protein